MQAENIFIVHPNTSEQANALKAFVKALKMKFEITTNETTYNPDFVAKIQKSKQEFKEGKSIRVRKEELQKYLGL